ncbi:unnamed protein product [Periconia digitata]|uniref:Uncharacterized protein n=1 Tax=Periconia digitata TaxID=1303443 RepID=A0A9W4UB17_9PLEO|nr:unnamed protein product [Periconia digitata]
MGLCRYLESSKASYHPCISHRARLISSLTSSPFFFSSALGFSNHFWCIVRNPPLRSSSFAYIRFQELFNVRHGAGPFQSCTLFSKFCSASSAIKEFGVLIM